MKCPSCNSTKNIVRDSRATENNSGVKRRRECTECSYRFTTIERIRFRELTVIKRTGYKRIFDREKIFKSVVTSMRKRNISDKIIEELVNDVVLKIETANLNEIHTHKIGQLVIEKLSVVDPVACIRFASVYKDFLTMQDFINFINKLRKTGDI
ncbi:transcriptional regulator NrdR [Rickettsia endosymbiont of Cardiosporidium cionae]|uniref:transcriptional regulator NrdR n=1 Tax=Rickettsia endosymbiont of Cardiosporidium cionae TaxID=2777155 RepID=UPI0018942532|nr:transcriptional regulator NrdR [Rickettsia endosymbiont of Cardiosporidium cionae]KAF8818108.1 Transcriptional repressor NrdR [Rickettsia endosymbiont of Cardiosporidium cionae]